MPLGRCKREAANGATGLTAVGRGWGGSTRIHALDSREPQS